MKKLQLFFSRLKEAREKAGMSFAAVATRWGVSEGYIRLLESGKKPFSKKMQLWLAKLELGEQQVETKYPPGEPGGEVIADAPLCFRDSQILRIVQLAREMRGWSKEDREAGEKEIIRISSSIDCPARAADGLDKPVGDPTGLLFKGPKQLRQLNSVHPALARIAQILGGEIVQDLRAVKGKLPTR
jgi:transcriptional regulator with XRE-family HTH domain